MEMYLKYILKSLDEVKAYTERFVSPGSIESNFNNRDAGKRREVANGNIIGITSSSLNKQLFDSENVNYAVKTIYLKRLLEKLPEKINLPINSENALKSTKDKINLFSDYITIIKIN
jgi:hypothetical protein